MGGIGWEYYDKDYFNPKLAPYLVISIHDGIILKNLEDQKMYHILKGKLFDGDSAVEAKVGETITFFMNKKSDYITPFTWELEKKKNMERAGEIIRLFNPKKVLEIGCARGFLLKALMMQGLKDVEGCDISKWAIENCELEVKEKLRWCDIREEIPYKPNSFDVVVALSILEHVEQECLDAVIKQICSISSKWIFIELPISLTLENKPLNEKDPTHVTYMNPSFWINLFYKNKFIIDLRRSTQTSNHPCHSIKLAFIKEKLEEK